MTTRLLIWSYESVIFAEPGDNAGHGILSEIIQCETQYLVCDILIAASCGGGHRDAAARNLEPSPAQPSPAQGENQYEEGEWHCRLHAAPTTAGKGW